jgi:hypothetical protein
LGRRLSPGRLLESITLRADPIEADQLRGLVDGGALGCRLRRLNLIAAARQVDLLAARRQRRHHVGTVLR